MLCLCVTLIARKGYWSCTEEPHASWYPQALVESQVSSSSAFKRSLGTNTAKLDQELDVSQLLTNKEDFSQSKL